MQCKKEIEILLQNRDYLKLYQTQPAILNELLLLTSQADFEDFFSDNDEPLGEDVFWQFYAAINGDGLIIDAYEGDATEKLNSYLQLHLPNELYTTIQHHIQMIFVDMGEDDSLETQIASCNATLAHTGYQILLQFDDTYYTGVYFLSISGPEQK